MEKCGDIEIDDGIISESKRKIVPAKVLRLFSINPRLQKLSMSSTTAIHMQWHEEGREMMVSYVIWPIQKLEVALDEVYPNFKARTRNVRLGLACDGF